MKELKDKLMKYANLKIQKPIKKLEVLVLSKH